MRTLCSFIVSVVLLCSLPLASAEELMEEEAYNYLQEGIAAQKTGDMASAISSYTKATHCFPQYAQAYNNLGTAYAQKGDLNKAEELYQRAISIDPHYVIALKNLALIYAQRKDYEKFFYYWKRATSLDYYSPFLIDDQKLAK